MLHRLGTDISHWSASRLCCTVIPTAAWTSENRLEVESGHPLTKLTWQVINSKIADRNRRWTKCYDLLWETKNINSLLRCMLAKTHKHRVTKLADKFYNWSNDTSLKWLPKQQVTPNKTCSTCNWKLSKTRLNFNWHFVKTDVSISVAIFENKRIKERRFLSISVKKTVQFY